MADSAILIIPEIAENQNNKYITHNNAVAFLEQATQRALPNSSVGAGPWTLTSGDFTRNFAFKASGASGAFDIVTPGDIGGAGLTKRVFVVINADTADTATVKSDAAGTTVVLPAGWTAIILQVGDDLTALSMFNSSLGTSIPYDIGVFIPGLPANAALVMQYVAPRAITLPDDFAGSVGRCATNPTTSAAVFDVLKNGSSVGSVSISTGGVFTFSTTGAGVSLAVGDYLSMTAPSPQNAALANVSIIFKGLSS